jgi:hypothetical protein
MRTTLNLADDALIAARNIAQRERLSLGDAVSELIRRGSAAPTPAMASRKQPALRGRFALLPVRDELITPQHIRALMEREGI